MASTTSSLPPPSKRPRPSSPLNAPSQSTSTASCPYLSTINIKALDFDLSPICSVTLTTTNIYICLTCGRYLQGRSPATPAHKHSLETSHRLYLNYDNEAVYCLPDAYLVSDPFLSRIASVLRPKYTPALIASLDKVPLEKPRLRGAVPLQKLHPTDYANTVVLFLLRPGPIRDHLLITQLSDSAPLHKSLAELCRKLWASDSFREHVSPHYLMHLLAETPRFGLLKRGDPLDLLAHMFKALHVKKNVGDPAHQFSQTLERSFRGEMLVDTTPPDVKSTRTKIQFWYLPLDLPAKPLFKDASERTLVPQIPLTHLLRKYDGVTKEHVVKTAAQRTYKLLRLPEYLILVVRRLTKSKFGVEKNPTVVHLPPILDLSQLLEGPNNYGLIAAVLHNGRPSDGDYRIALRHDATGNWYELSDTKVSRTQHQLVSLADSCLLLYERKSA